MLELDFSDLLVLHLARQPVSSEAFPHEDARWDTARITPLDSCYHSTALIRQGLIRGAKNSCSGYFHRVGEEGKAAEIEQKLRQFVKKA
jgi:hypothetical protein